MTKTQTAILGMGCFWKPELLFSETEGILSTKVGYIGGDEKKYPNPTYDEVCSNKTGYIEAILVQFNPEKISYKKILEIFWKNHNPTTPNRQGPDIGTQYKSSIFYYNKEQEKIANKSKEEIQKKYENKKVVTEIRKASTFFPAEDYHQKYLEKRDLRSCHI